MAHKFNIYAGNPDRPKKHPCKDCTYCQFCPDDRCKVCLRDQCRTKSGAKKTMNASAPESVIKKKKKSKKRT
jgi:hypothetical protein